MLRLLVKWLVYTAVIALFSELHPRVRIRSVAAAAVAALVLGVLNVLLGWLLGFLFALLLFIPAVLSFGLAFLLVPILVNMVLLRITAALLEDEIAIDGTGPLLGLSTAIAITGALLRAAG